MKAVYYYGLHMAGELLQEVVDIAWLPERALTYYLGAMMARSETERQCLANVALGEAIYEYGEDAQFGYNDTLRELFE